MNRTRAHYRRWKSRIMIGLMALGLLACLVPLVSLLMTLLLRGSPVFDFSFISSGWAPVGEGGGIGHAIAGSVCLLVVALVLAVPLGLAKGIYLSQRSETRIARLTRTLLDVMSGIPAIIVGVFVYTLLVKPISGYSMLAGSVALAMIMLPIFARTTEEAMRQIPRTVDEAGLALGLARRRVVLRILLRSAMPGVLSGLFLALARVAGEAAPLLFTAFGSNDWPRGPLQPVGSLPQLLFDYARAPFEELIHQAWGAALVLVAMIVATRLLTHLYLGRRYGRDMD